MYLCVGENVLIYSRYHCLLRVRTHTHMRRREQEMYCTHSLIDRYCTHTHIDIQDEIYIEAEYALRIICPHTSTNYTIRLSLNNTRQTCTCIRTNTHTGAHGRTQTCVQVHTHTYTYTQRYTNAHTHTHAHTVAEHANTLKSMYARINERTCACARIVTQALTGRLVY